jgi:hydroxyacylglutathione hydrolase
MNVAVFALGEMQANCYIVTDPLTKSCIVIDPGDSADFIAEYISTHNLVLTAILATHGHIDHIMAVGELQLLFNSSIPFYMHKDDLFLVERLEVTAKHYFKNIDIVIKPVNIVFIEDVTLVIESFNFDIIKLPGHTPGGVGFYSKSEQCIFSGDIIFKEGIGRYDFSYSNKAKLQESVRMVQSLPLGTTVYCGHDESFML